MNLGALKTSVFCKNFKKFSKRDFLAQNSSPRTTKKHLYLPDYVNFSMCYQKIEKIIYKDPPCKFPIFWHRCFCKENQYLLTRCIVNQEKTTVQNDGSGDIDESDDPSPFPQRPPSYPVMTRFNRIG